VYDAFNNKAKMGLRGISISMNIWRKRVTALLLAVVFLLIFDFYGRAIILVLFTRYEIRNSPDLWIVPTPLSAGAAESPAGKTLSYYGYSLDSPWAEVKEEKPGKVLTSINFSGGQVISVCDPASTLDDLEALRQGIVTRGQTLKNVFGDEATRSRFAFRSTTLNLTPRDLRLFSSRQEIATNSTLLMIKEVWVNNSRHGPYSFQTAWFRGFQYGSPAQDDGVTIEAFDAEDHEIEIMVGWGLRISPRPSQADINRIIFSLRPTPPAEPPPATIAQPTKRPGAHAHAV
jgi:hypothetical protein